MCKIVILLMVPSLRVPLTPYLHSIFGKLFSLLKSFVVIEKSEGC